VRVGPDSPMQVQELRHERVRVCEVGSEIKTPAQLVTVCPPEARSQFQSRVPGISSCRRSRGERNTTLTRYRPWSFRPRSANLARPDAGRVESTRDPGGDISFSTQMSHERCGGSDTRGDRSRSGLTHVHQADWRNTTRVRISSGVRWPLEDGHPWDGAARLCSHTTSAAEGPGVPNTQFS